MSSGFVIDDKGRAWPDDAAVLARRAGGQAAYIAAHAVRERGFIHARPQEGGLRVSVRAGRFTAAALAGLLYALKDRPPRHILLAVLGDGGWTHDMFVSLWELAERLETLMAGAPSGPRAPWIAVERDLAAPDAPYLQRVRPLLDLWRAKRGRLDDDLLQATDRLGLRDRAILARRLPGSSRLMVEHFGAGIRIFRPCESLLAVGQGVDEMPDPRYGAWLTEAYNRGLSDGRPRFEAIRAVIATSTGISLRVRYDRLLMPCLKARNDLHALIISIRKSVFIQDLAAPSLRTPGEFSSV